MHQATAVMRPQRQGNCIAVSSSAAVARGVGLVWLDRDRTAPDAGLRHLLVRSVAQWLVLGGLAATEIGGRAFGSSVFHGRERPLNLVRTIAKRLGLALAASAPPVVFALLDIDCEGCVRGTNRKSHARSSHFVFLDSTGPRGPSIDLRLFKLLSGCQNIGSAGTLVILLPAVLVPAKHLAGFSRRDLPFRFLWRWRVGRRRDRRRGRQGAFDVLGHGNLRGTWVVGQTALMRATGQYRPARPLLPCGSAHTPIGMPVGSKVTRYLVPESVQEFALYVIAPTQGPPCDNVVTRSVCPSCGSWCCTRSRRVDTRCAAFAKEKE